MTDRDPKAANAAITWAWASIEQLARLKAITQDLAATARQRPTNYTHETRIPFLRRTMETQFALVAIRNLDRALDDLGAEVALPEAISKDVLVLRNSYEHWDQERNAHRGGAAGRSFREHEENHPDTHPLSYSFNEDGEALLGGAVSTVELRRVVQEVLDELLGMEKANKL
jgi:hypothetical protein